MTLLITLFATVAWYVGKGDSLRIGTLCFMYWGASLMWTVDATFEYAELGEKYFTPAFADMVNEAYLGFYVGALGLVVWVARLLIADPRGRIRACLTRRGE